MDDKPHRARPKTIFMEAAVVFISNQEKLPDRIIDIT